jgi:D-alanyl-D-alanine carboxypeptidase (penicillin-binding protein 5/6)
VRATAAPRRSARRAARARARAALVAALTSGTLAASAPATLAAGTTTARTTTTTTPAPRTPFHTPPLAARAWIAWEPDLGVVVSSHDANRELPIGSTTKIMTALVTLEREPLQRLLTVVNYPRLPSESTAGLGAGEHLSVADLLRAVLLPSANEAAQTLAIDVGGSVAAFVDLMNADAHRLGLRHTHYSTPVGLDTPGNYSTATDLVRLAGVLLERYMFFARTVDKAQLTLHTGAHPRTISNENDLVGQAPYVDGVKTGHTIDAGYVLVASAKHDGVRILTAVLGDPSRAARDADTLALLRTGLAAFRPMDVVKAGAVLASAAERYRSTRVPLVAAAPLHLVVPVGSTPAVSLVGVPARVEGPLPAGAHEGSIVVRVGGRTVARTPLVTASAVPKATIGERLRDYLGRPLTILLLLGVLGCSLLLVGLRMRAVRRLQARPSPPAGVAR